VGSVTDGRLKQAQEVWWFWKKLPNEASLRDWTDREFKQYERDTLKRLAELCLPEISEAFLEVGLERFSEITTKIASSAIYHAAETVTKTKRPIHDHVKVCVKEALEGYLRSFSEWFYQAEGEQLLPLLLSLPRSALARLGEYLNREQRRELRQLLYRELGNKPMLLPLDREPLGQRKWLYWYLWRREMTQPGVEETLGGVPRYLFVGDGDALPTNKQTGEPLDPLGPIHAKVWPRLGRELNKRGHPIKDPESKSRTARSLGVDRATLERYLRADVGKAPEPDGKGGVSYTYTDSDVIRSIETVLRKRGPQPLDR
jgi:hypothetical protein